MGDDELTSGPSVRVGFELLGMGFCLLAIHTGKEALDLPVNHRAK